MIASIIATYCDIVAYPFQGTTQVLQGAKRWKFAFNRPLSGASATYQALSMIHPLFVPGEYERDAVPLFPDTSGSLDLGVSLKPHIWQANSRMSI